MDASAAADADRDAVRNAIADYFAAFSRGAKEAATYYGEPTLLVMPDRIATLDNLAAIEAHLEGLLARLAPLGYAHSQLSDPRVKLLNATTAICSTARIRTAADGSELPGGGATYLLRKAGSGWKIHALIATDADKLVSED